MDLRDPRKLHFPALDHAITAPLWSVIETIVLLKDARTLATPEVTFFDPLALRTLMDPISSFSSSSAVGWRATPPINSTGLASIGAAGAAGATADGDEPSAAGAVFGAFGAFAGYDSPATDAVLAVFSFLGADFSSAM